MKDYLRRTLKFVVYLAVIFILVLVVFPLISRGTAPSITFQEIMTNQRFQLFLGFLLAYALVYPWVAYVKIRRHLNGSFADNRRFFEQAFETLQYIKTAETPDRIVYRKKSQLARFTQWYEDSIVITPNEHPVIISGMRKTVTRLDRLIDQLLIKASE